MGVVVVVADELSEAGDLCDFPRHLLLWLARRITMKTMRMMKQAIASTILTANSVIQPVNMADGKGLKICKSVTAQLMLVYEHDT